MNAMLESFLSHPASLSHDCLEILPYSARISTVQPISLHLATNWEISPYTGIGQNWVRTLIGCGVLTVVVLAFAF